MSSKINKTLCPHSSRHLMYVTLSRLQQLRAGTSAERFAERSVSSTNEV